MATLIIGAGLIGMTTAYALSAAGEEVIVLERRDGPGEETSRANGSLLHPSLVEPWNTPGIAQVLLRDMGRENAAVLLRARPLPSLIGWGLRFLRESSERRHYRNTLRNLHLARLSVRSMAALREDTGIRYHHQPRGSLTVYREAATYGAALRRYERLAAYGLETTALDPDALVALDGALAPVADRLHGGVFAPIDECGDPHAFCVALHHCLARRGVEFRFGHTVARIAVSGDRARGVELAGGRTVRADRVVLAGGSWSVPLARRCGLRLPVRPVKGYSLTLPRGTSGTAPVMPVTDTSLHLAVVPVGEERIRVAGTAEFAGFDSSVRPARTAYLWRMLQDLYPRFAEASAGCQRNGWAGLRPMCPDGVPLIGATSIDGLFLNTGHGQLGWTLAAGSGRLLADLVLGRTPAVEAADFAPQRFAGA